MNLKKRHNTYFVRRRVPADLVALVGKSEIVRTTGTTDEKEARRRSYAILAQIEDEFRRAAALAATNPVSPSWVQAIGRELRRAVERGELDGETASHLMHDSIEKHLAVSGADPDEVSETNAATLSAAYHMVRHPDDLPLSEVIKLHLEEREGDVVASTLYSKRRELQAFADWLRADLPIKQITRQQAGSYVSVLKKRDCSPKTNLGSLGVLVAFFNWAIRKDLYTVANPFAGHAVDLRGSRRGSSEGERRAWTQDELRLMVEGLKPEDVRWQACIIAMYTGMRREEVATLKAADVKLAEDCMVIPEGKNQSSVRKVPIHPVIKPLIKRLTKASTDGYLLAGLDPSGLDGRRANNLGKRIGRWLHVNLEITDAGVVFHSLRNTFINRCENEGIATTTTNLITGHKRQNMGYGTYSKGVAFPILKAAMERVSYGDLDQIVTERLTPATE